MHIVYIFTLFLFLNGQVWTLKLTSLQRSPRSSLTLNAKRRSKLRKQVPKMDKITQYQIRPPDSGGDYQTQKVDVGEEEKVSGKEVSNPYVVKTAPLVIKKGVEPLSTQIDYDDNWGRVPDTQEPSMMRSSQARLSGEGPTSRLTTKNNAKILGASFQSDLEEFNVRMMAGAESRKQEVMVEEEGGIMKTVKDALSLVMVVDFFVVMVFLVWFLAAAAMQKTNPWLLERFQDIFQPVVVPSLTVLMAGSIASGLLGPRNARDYNELY